MYFLYDADIWHQFDAKMLWVNLIHCYTEFMSTEIRNLLEKELQARRERNAGYSIRAMARDIGLDQSTLCRVLSGKRSLSKSLIDKLLPKLSLSELELQSLLDSQAGAKDNSVEPKQLPVEHFLVQSQWYYDAILELSRIESFKPNIAWIAAKLSMDTATVKRAVDRLFSLGYLKDEEGRWVDTTGTNSFFPLENASEAQSIYQKQVLQNSAKALENTPVSDRNHSSVTIAASQEKMMEVKKRIHEFQKEIMAYLEEDKEENLDSLYQLQIGYFPLVRPENKKQENIEKENELIGEGNE